MKKETSLYLLGILVIILPYFGFPNNWRKFLFFVFGAIIIYIAYMYRREKKIREAKSNSSNDIQKEMKPFIDNMDERV